jgi:hypothetical protein
MANVLESFGWGRRQDFSFFFYFAAVGTTTAVLPLSAAVTSLS